jgi:hypothetical protein
MTNNPNTPESLDPHLKALLDELRPAPERDPKVAAQGKANFIAEVDSFLAAQASLPKPSFAERVRQKLPTFSPGFGQRRVASFAAVLVVLVLIFGGAGMTAVAAQAALPGDALYSVKTGLEGTRASLTGSAASQVSLYLQFAERRLAEIEKLIAEGRYADIQLATQEFEAHIQNALASLSKLAVEDPAQASSLALQITEALARYAQALGTMSAAAPEPARLELEKAVQASQAAVQLNSLPGSEVEFTGQVTSLSPGEVVVTGQRIRLTTQTELKVQLQVGLLVKVHARRGADGSLEAREIELAGSLPGNQNQNGSPEDPIGNSNQNGDDNQNESGDQNANDNSDDRQGDSENDNQNLNANGDDSNDIQTNSNDNQSGDDSNDNDNQNDDDSNKNDNDQKDNNND